ncbi:Cgr1 [Amanita muscaria]|uniref:rRNA-processing protein n=1 Tax=Amanita muscaria (strain Koide BX008) TaxID=946122 RepID=A0A0C2T737_AMAMK|nr:hypothetical protein M378DRAFT_20062 [Amanita muscaria Koide BX008]
MEADSVEPPVVALRASSNGRVSGKPWKAHNDATVRSQMSRGLKTKNWDKRMEKTQKALAVKKLQDELKEEKETERRRRREVTMERKRAAEEKRRLEEEKTKMGARKAARLRRRAGRTKKINH